MNTEKSRLKAILYTNVDPYLGPIIGPVARAMRAIVVRAPRWFVLMLWRRRVAVAAIILVLAVAHGITTVVLGRRVEAEIAKIKARGEPVSGAEIGLPKVPDAENGALVYARAFAKLPVQVQPSKAGEQEFDYWAIIPASNGSSSELDAAAIEKARKIVNARGDLAALLEEASGYPTCQFPVDWKAGAGALFPHCARLREVARFAGAKAIFEAHDGNMAGATRWVEVAFRVAESEKDEPSLISQLVRYAAINLAFSSLQGVIQTKDISAQQSAKLNQTLASIDLSPGWTKGMQGERVMGGLWAFDHVQKDRRGLEDLSGESQNPGLWRVLGSTISVWKPILYADELAYLRLMEKQESLSRLPWREAKPDFDKLSRDAKDLPDYAIVTRIMYPVFSRALQARDTATARIALARTALGLSAYHSRFGAYPKSLDELRTKMNWRLQEDPFSGKGLLYRTTERGFVLHSIGANMTDDGGRSPERGQTWREADIVFRIER